VEWGVRGGGEVRMWLLRVGVRVGARGGCVAGARGHEMKLIPFTH
jgi:hypothetical protein